MSKGKAVIVKASGSVALANQDIQDSWQWLASGFSGSVIQEFKIGPGGWGLARVAPCRATRKSS